MSTGPINFNSAVRFTEGTPVTHSGWVCSVVDHSAQYTRKIMRLKPMAGSPLMRVANAELGCLIDVKIADLSYYVPMDITRPTATALKKKMGASAKKADKAAALRR